MKAILYARVSSTDKQDPEMQLAELREYASRQTGSCAAHLWTGPAAVASPVQPWTK